MIAKKGKMAMKKAPKAVARKRLPKTGMMMLTKAAKRFK